MQFLSCEDFSRFAVMGFARSFVPSLVRPERGREREREGSEISDDVAFFEYGEVSERPEERSDIG